MEIQMSVDRASLAGGRGRLCSYLGPLVGLTGSGPVVAALEEIGVRLRTRAGLLRRAEVPA